MKEFQLNKKKYTVPECWDEVTLRDQIKYGEIKEELETLIRRWEDQQHLLASTINELGIGEES